MARHSIVGAVVVAAIALGSLVLVSAQPTTRLILEISGGFAFIEDTPQMLHVAYLDDVNEPICKVTQIGTELTVLRGNIIDSQPSLPPNRTYNLDRALVTFAGMPASTMTRSRTAGTPSNVNSPASWTDLQFLPSLKEFHTGSTLKGSWKGDVKGYMTLRGGTISGSFPTDPLVQSTYFKFAQNSTPKGTSAVTDRVIYTVDVQGNYVQINFGRSTYTRVRVEPAAPGQPVRLRLRGLHSMGTAASYANGDEIKDFCAFYSLLKPATGSSSPWPATERLKMFYVNTTTAPSGGGQPSPGFFCDGVWF